MAWCKQNPGGAPSFEVSAGFAKLGEQVVVHGKDLHRECLGYSYVRYLIFCATGEEPDPRICRVLEQMWIATGYPDARIWCNRVAAYLGSARVPPAWALCAALSACNGTAYGFGAMEAAFEVQAELPLEPEARAARLDCWLEERRLLAGYGRPLERRDERIAVALKVLAAAELVAGPHLVGAYWLHQQLRKRKGIEWNISAVWAACCLDFGFTRAQYREMMLLMFVPGHVATYADQRGRPVMTFLRGYRSGADPSSSGHGNE